MLEASRYDVPYRKSMESPMPPRVHSLYGRTDDAAQELADLVGSNVRSRMIRKGWSASDLGRAMNDVRPRGADTVIRQYVDRIINSENVPRPDYLVLLAKVLGCTPEDLTTKPKQDGMRIEYLADGRARLAVDLTVSLQEAAEIMSILAKVA